MLAYIYVLTMDNMCRYIFDQYAYFYHHHQPKPNDIALLGLLWHSFINQITTLSRRYLWS